MIPGKQYTPELVLGIAWKRKWLILIPAILIAAGVSTVTYLLPDQYRSDTLILVVPQRVPESYVRSTITTRIEDRLQSISQQILSRTRLERIIQEFNLYADRRETDIMEDIVQDMRDNVSVQIVQGDAFRVGFTADDPRMAMRVTERLASFFIDESLRDREVLAEGTSQFLESQLEESRRRLVENEQKLVEYRRRFDGELPTQVEANMQGLHNVEMQIQALLGTINRDRDRQLILQRAIADASTPVSSETSAGSAPVPADDPVGPGTAAAQLAVAEAQLRGLLQRLTPEHPDVVRMRRTVAELQERAMADAATQPVSDPAPPVENRAELARERRVQEATAELERVDRAIQANTAEEARLRKMLAEYQRRIEVAPVRDAELTELMRDYTTLQDGYTSLLAKKQDSQISANLERRQIGEQFRVLDPARLPSRPVSPDRPRLYLLGVLGAIAIGLLCAAVAEYLDRGLKSEEDVRLALGLPVVAMVPLIEDAPSGQKRRGAVAAVIAAVISLAVSAVAAAFVLLR